VTDAGRDWLAAGALFLGLLVVYNANGREIGSSDSQPTKFEAREFLLRGTLSLNHVIGATPEYADRWGFILTADGTYRSVYSPVPAILAAVLTWPFWKAGIIDIRAPLAPALMAKTTASILVASAVTLAFVTARRRISRRRAILVALGLGLGTGFWSVASQTLWQTETAVFGLALAVFAFCASRERIQSPAAIAIGAGLGLMGTARPQLAPVVLILLAGTWTRAKPQHAATATAIIVAFVFALCTANLRWFGHPLGAQALLQGLNGRLHATETMFQLRFEGFLGLLFSPSRGLFIFSPVVLLSVAGVRRSFAAGWGSPLPWCVLALVAQYALYGSYAVWWGGHTFGPRYLLDILPLAVPLATAALEPPGIGRWSKALLTTALAWSVAVAATGAFCYPYDQWNTDPESVDRHHARLWSVSDNQITRCWKRGLSPQNFGLIDRAAVRRGPP